MDTLWPLAIILAVGIVLLLVWVRGAYLFPGSRVTTRAFWCPFRGRNVQVGFAEAVWDGRLVDVERCSAFTPPTAVTCDKACLRLADVPELR